jgi:hypothetical protein
MRRILAGGLLILLGAQEQMVAPKVEHNKREERHVYDDVTRSCPAGYEGHGRSIICVGITRATRAPEGVKRT